MVLGALTCFLERVRGWVVGPKAVPLPRPGPQTLSPNVHDAFAIWVEGALVAYAQQIDVKKAGSVILRSGVSGLRLLRYMFKKELLKESMFERI